MENLLKRTEEYNKYMSDLQDLLSELFGDSEWEERILEGNIDSVCTDNDELYFSNGDDAIKNTEGEDMYTVFGDYCIKSYENVHIFLTDYEDDGPVNVYILTKLTIKEEEK